MTKQRAVFLDRDGTIIVDKGYVHLSKDVELLPRAAEAIGLLRENGYLILVVTNQSGVARGLFQEEDVIATNNHINALLQENGTSVDNFYYCPHLPNGIVPEYSFDCDCRKPKGGLFEKAISDFDIELASSWAIGDSERDVEPAKALGMNTVLIGNDQSRASNNAPSLYEAALFVIHKTRRKHEKGI